MPGRRYPGTALAQGGGRRTQSLVPQLGAGTGADQSPPRTAKPCRRPSALQEATSSAVCCRLTSRKCGCCALVTPKYRPGESPVRGLTDRVHDYSGRGRAEKCEVHAAKSPYIRHCRGGGAWSAKPAGCSITCFRSRRLKATERSRDPTDSCKQTWVAFGLDRAGPETESCRIGSFWKNCRPEKEFGPRF